MYHLLWKCAPVIYRACLALPSVKLSKFGVELVATEDRAFTLPFQSGGDGAGGQCACSSPVMWICRVQAKGGHGFPLYHPLAPSSLLRVPPTPKARAVQRCCKGPRWPRQVQAVHGFVVLERFIMHDERGAGPIVPAQLLSGSHHHGRQH